MGSQEPGIKSLCILQFVHSFVELAARLQSSGQIIVCGCVLRAPRNQTWPETLASAVSTAGASSVTVTVESVPPTTMRRLRVLVSATCSRTCSCTVVLIRRSHADGERGRRQRGKTERTGFLSLKRLHRSGFLVLDGDVGTGHDGPGRIGDRTFNAAGEFAPGRWRNRLQPPAIAR